MFSFTDSLLSLLPRSKLKRFRQMRRFDFVAVRQVRNRPCQFQDAMIRTHPHLHLLHRRTRQILARVVYRTKLAHFGGSYIAVALQTCACESPALQLTRFFHACSNRF